MHGYRRAAALCLALLFAGSAQAAEQSERLVYNIMVGGLHLGDAMIGLKESPAGYSTEMKVAAKGVAKWVQNFRSDMHGEGSFAESKPIPAAFTRQWSTSDVAADLKMTFDPATGEAATQERYFNPQTDAPIAEENLPWNDGKRARSEKPVPADLRKGVLDPMAAFIAARGQIMAQGLDGKSPKSFRVPIYDGKRRYDIVGRAEPARNVAIGDVQRSVIPVIAKIEPVFGFAPRAQERMKNSEGKFLFSNDARFIPLQLVVSNDLLSGVMNLTADCSVDAARCDNFGQEKDE